MDHSDFLEECLHSVKSEELVKMECGVEEEVEDFSSQGLKSEGVVGMEEGDERPEEEVKLEDPLPQGLHDIKVEEELDLRAELGGTEDGEGHDSEGEPREAVDPLSYPGDCYFSCYHCGFETPASNVLKEHILNRREEQCPISCSQCTFNCSDLPSLRVHRHYWHGEERPSSSASGQSSVQSGHSTDRPHSIPGVQPSHSNGRFYACPHCEYSCLLHSSLIKHIQTCRFNDRPHSCPHCDFTSAEYPSLRKHIQACHSNGSFYSCPYCEYSCLQILSLKRHIRTSHSLDLPLSSPAYRSSATGQPTSRSQAAKQEESAQSRKLPLDDKVTGPCLSALPSATTEKFAVHPDSKRHSEEKSITVPCLELLPKSEGVQMSRTTLKEGTASSALKKDQGRTVTASLGSRRYACDVCQARFSRLHHLKGHQRIHTQEKPYACDVCQARFSLSSHLKRHQRTHNKEKPYACDVCPARFTQSSNLRTHQRIHTQEKPYVCDVCSVRFTQLCHLKKHHSTHTKEKPYTCDVCQARFARSGYLMVHKRTHTQEKPYVCDVCSTRFTQSSNLRTHQKIHTKEKRYACDVCPARFTQLPLLNKHRITHTSERPIG